MASRFSLGLVPLLLATFAVISEGQARADSGASSDGPVSAHAIATPKGEGTVLGFGESFSAGSSAGNFTARVPFVVPAGRGGVQPALSLAYSSATGTGVAGVGWDLPLPFIARQTDKGIPRYADAANGAWTPEQDRFVFNGGQELVPLCTVRANRCAGAPTEVMPAWADGYQYFRARVEGDFQRFFWSPDHRTWRVQAKSGFSVELGVPLDGGSDTSALEVDPTDARRIYKWHIARQYDNQGPTPPASEARPTPPNVVVFRYENVGGTAYVTDAYDSPPASGWEASGVDAYAHHVHFTYETRPDPVVTYRPGFRVALTRRLAGVDVTSKTFGASGARELVRRYHITYEAERAASLLKSVQLEGRCAAPVLEDESGVLASTSCPRLPPMTFSYSTGSGAASAPGFGAYDDSFHMLAGAPSRELSHNDLAFLDVNGDGLVDLLRTSAATGLPDHSVFFNGASHTAGALAAPVPMAPETGSLSSSSLALDSSNVVPLDIDGDGRLDLLHMPVGPQSRVFAPRLSSGKWTWAGRSMTTPIDSGSYLDVTGKRDNLRVMDVNGDGLVDIVVTESSKIRTYLNLGRYPGGAGRFGSASWASATTATLREAPLEACLPGENTALRFEESSVLTGDFNGDGLVDIAELKLGKLTYYPGRGDGSWGVVPPPGCGRRPAGVRGGVELALPTNVAASSSDAVRVADVTGDGLDDVIHVSGRDVDVYVNESGVAFSATPLHARTDRMGTLRPELVRVADVDGNGTTDIVIGTDSGYAYVDVLGATRPNVLTRMSNGRGATTDVAYEPSTARMLADAAAGAPWERTMPIVTQVVRSVTVDNNLPVAGRPSSRMTTTYDYRDPVYDGAQREFRGFATVLAKSDGDQGSPPATTRTTFLTGDCVDETADRVDDCAPEGRWRANGREALKGLPVSVETFADTGVYLSTVHTTYTLRHLFTGLDGRSVRHAFASATDSYLYDTAAFTGEPSSVLVADVVLDGVNGTAPEVPLTLRSSAGRAHVRSTRIVDAMGNVTVDAGAGCVEGCSDADEVITKRTEFARPAGDLSGWLVAPVRTWVEGSATGRHKESLFEVDDRGRVRVTRAVLSGSVPLSRTHESQQSAPASAGASPLIAPAPPFASQDGIIVTSATDFDIFGNAVFQRAANNRCRRIELDGPFATLAVSEAIYVGAVAGDQAPSGSLASAAFAATPAGSGCGERALVTTAAYDRGFGLPTATTGIHGERTTARYDGLGRLTALYRPDPMMVGLSEATPSEEVEYDIDPTGARPFIVLHTKARAGASTRGDEGAVAKAVGIREAWGYVDGFGRTIVTLQDADPAAGDEGKSIVAGLTEYDAKGAPHRVFLPWVTNEDPAHYPLDAAPSTPSTLHEYDAFGREIRTTDTAGDVSRELRLHALTTDLWDGADLRSQAHKGTFTTERRDGHGRLVATIQRMKVGSALTLAETRTDYLATGEVARITRTANGQAPVVRWIRYDSLGRMVENADPHTTKAFALAPAPDGSMRALRYAYDDAGDLVGTSDARGCGVNFMYDAGGREIGEDFSPCLASQQAYTSPDWVTGDGTEVFYRYDEPEADAPAECTQDAVFLVGRVSSVSDRGGRLVTSYDARGRTVCASRRVAKPGDTASSLDERYAANWFSQEVVFDDSDRAIFQSTGATAIELLGKDGTSAIRTSYTRRGLVDVAGSSYGPLVNGVRRDASGKVTRIDYADGASTRTVFTYDANQRVETVKTSRGAASLWTQSTATYTPAPGGMPSTLQRVLDDLVFGYDEVGNPVSIQDNRDPAEWPAGAKPVSRAIRYDDAYRATDVAYTHDATNDAWVSPHDAENRGVHPDPRRAAPAPHAAFDGRVLHETTSFDALGNMTASDDDAHGFYDRSLGAITNNAAAGRPYQLVAASNDAADTQHHGNLSAAYDDAGYLVSLAVTRNGPCLPAGASCSMRMAYDWDEVGNLVRARRWDVPRAGLATEALPSAAPAVDLRFAYDTAHVRVLKTAVDATGEERHSVYPMATLELRGARYDNGAYERTALTEVPYLFAHGVRLARVVYAHEDLPSLTSGRLHVFLTLPDHLGSTSTVLDRDTGEVVERATYMAFGSTDSDYRPERWGSFREEHRFTGKEDDAEVGLSYFGHRYFAPSLGRWISADPLAVHSPGAADLNLYAYVHGQVFAAVDPNGLAETCVNGACQSYEAPQEQVSAQSLNSNASECTSGGCMSVSPSRETLQSIHEAYVRRIDRPLETPPIDPIDFVPSGAIAGGAKVLGKVALRSLTAKGAQAGLELGAKGAARGSAKLAARGAEDYLTVGAKQAAAKGGELSFEVGGKVAADAEAAEVKDGVTRLWRAVEGEELKDVMRFGDYNIHPNSTFKRFALREADLDAFIKATPERSYTKTFVDVPTNKLQFMYEHPDPGGVGRAVGIDVYETPQFYNWFIDGVNIVH